MAHVDLASGQKGGRSAADEIVIFDSCGSGVQDVAVAWAAYQAARASRTAQTFNLSGQPAR
jgi:ornithine cyclodeaminase/alanine dehydrogenase-like protein (mu-crystallin family)